MRNNAFADCSAKDNNGRQRVNHSTNTLKEKKWVGFGGYHWGRLDNVEL